MSSTPASVICVLVAVGAMGVMLFGNDPALESNAQLFGLLFAAGAVTTGAIGTIKDSGGRRILALLSLLVAGGIVSSVMFPDSPIGFERLQKVADGESDDPESNDPSSTSPQPESVASPETEEPAEAEEPAAEPESAAAEPEPEPASEEPEETAADGA